MGDRVRNIEKRLSRRMAAAGMAVCALLALAAAPIAAAVNEFLPRDAPPLKRFAIVAGTANNQCFTTQLINNDVRRLRANVLLSPCEFNIDNLTQGFFISRPLQQDAYQIFFAANPSYCLAMEPRTQILVASACALNTEMLEQLPQLWDIKGGGLSLKGIDGKKWCLDTRARQGFSAIFEPHFSECPEQIPDAFILRVNR
ncbi:MAG: hypothetical protein OJJ21_06890 [Ferrovibrio sp.]|uniref:hypothetical protein n=1 Tax=Ferrovibrio sp. TaxID=1917215 RepID=UPI002634711F|nr:hypothetical protein [Ferrovibrio sp.]MCW0233306.1 hypothetical protein [Ferrovibrio sp.]